MRVLITSALVALFSAGAATATIYRCDVRQSVGKEWITANYTIDHNPISNEIQVFDSFINSIYQGPIAVRKYNKTRRKLRVNWTVEGSIEHATGAAAGTGYQEPILFEAVVKINSGKMQLRAYGPNGERVSGRGDCTIR